MIRKLSSSLPTFKEVVFHEGLNLIIVDAESASSRGHTRNSAGKTSIVELIHFLLGGEPSRRSIVSHPDLASHTFSMSLDVGESVLCVERGCSRRERSKIRVTVESGGVPALAPVVDSESGSLAYAKSEWKTLLGNAFFGLPLVAKGTDHERKWSPSFRSMISYFARRENDGGFRHPDRFSENQQRCDYQINLSYLFGTDWIIPWDLEMVRERERSLRELKKAARIGALGGVVGRVAELRPKLKVAEEECRTLRERLSRFEVHDAYRELASRAAKARVEMGKLTTRCVTVRETLGQLRRAMEVEVAPSGRDIAGVYRAAQVELPEVPLRRLEEVTVFFESVVANRRSHLEEEVQAANRECRQLEERIAALDAERSGILRELASKGALEDFVALQQRVSEHEVRVSAIGEQLRAAEMLEGETTQLNLDRTAILRRLQRDHGERGEHLATAAVEMSRVIRQLYQEREGSLVAEATENGPEFQVSIEGDRGGGISKMEIFCMDVVLGRVNAERFGGPGFLIHDSHLFDGVDSRQITSAIEIGLEFCKQIGWQYIVMLNSDVYDKLDLSSGIDIESVRVPLELTDRTENGGLFGFQLE